MKQSLNINRKPLYCIKKTELKIGILYSATNLEILNPKENSKSKEALNLKDLVNITSKSGHFKMEYYS